MTDRDTAEKLPPLPAPEQVWMTQGVGAMHAYSERQMREYARAALSAADAALAQPKNDETMDEAGAAAAALYDRWTGKA